MPNLCILEYSDIGTTQRGSIAIPLEPPLGEHGLEITSQSRQSASLGKLTSIVKLVADADCAIAVGEDPDATNSLRFLAAGREQLITVAPGSNFKIAAVSSGVGSMSDSLGAFLKVIASPAESQKKLDGLNKQAAVIDASAQSLRAATEAHKQAKAEADAAAKAADDAIAKAAQAANDLAKQKSEFEARQDAYTAKVESDAALADATAKDFADREAALAGARADLAKKSDQIAKAGSDLDVREKDLADRASAVAAIKADYEARIAKLKALTA